MKLRKRSIQHGTNRNETKKRRSDQYQNDITRSTIEDLPSEIWFEIFSYFDGQSLLDSFSSINLFVQSILNDIRLRIHFHLDSSNQSSLQFFHSNQISSLSIDFSFKRIYEHLHFDSLIRLRSLRLIDIKEKQLQELSQMQWKSLVRLSIQSECAKYLLKILSIYFPLIEQIELHSCDNEFLLKCFKLEKQISQVQHLRLNGRIRLSKLFRLWPWIPRLESLSMYDGGIHQCDYWIDQDLIYQNEFPPNLFKIHLKIFDDDLSFKNFERLIGKTLRHLKISGSIADDDLEEYLSSDNWIRLISRCSDRFESIQLDLSSYYDPSDPTGLQKMLIKFRQNDFFQQCKIRSQKYFITIRGFIRPRSRSEEEFH